ESSTIRYEDIHSHPSDFLKAICHLGLKPQAIINRPYKTVEAPSGRQTIARQFIAGWPKR
ncbi:MAG TPA: hypothetical protein HPP90_08020, partial [Deltaproteobacteria bacterium]|nr:hypothetical protein [Deltaproteobacteria bacterium]